MGATKFNLTQLELSQPEEMYLKLLDPARPLKDLGELKVVVTLTPKSQEDKEQVGHNKLIILFLPFTIFFWELLPFCVCRMKKKNFLVDFHFFLFSF